MRWLTEFFKGTPVHIFGGALVGMFYTWFIIGSPHTEELSGFVNTIMTISASLLAAGAAIASASWGTERRRADDIRAAKVTLPLALTEFIRVSETGIRYSLEDEVFFKSAENRARYLSDISLSKETLETIRLCVASADETSARWLTVLVQHYQLYNARFVSIFDHENYLYDDYDKASRVVNWLLLKAITSHLFKFSRGGPQVSDTLNFEKVQFFLWDTNLPNGLQEKILEQSASVKEFYAPHTVDRFELHQAFHTPWENE